MENKTKKSLSTRGWVLIMSGAFLLLFASFLAAYLLTGNDVLAILSITFGICAYHFLMRLLVGFLFDSIFKNHMDWNLFWFREKKFELHLYSWLRVGKWKRFAPTYRKEYFDFRERNPEELIGATCQAELVHETIAILSLLPIVSYIWFGAFWAMLITSLAASLMDICLAIIQRYNGPRLIKLMQRLKKN